MFNVVYVLGSVQRINGLAVKPKKEELNKKKKRK